MSRRMQKQFTITELENRWRNALELTRYAVAQHPAYYRELKRLVHDILDNPLDINAYLPTAEKLMNLLKLLDPEGRGSIFYLFYDRFAPAKIWQVSLFRVECRDLLAYLNVFDDWRRQSNHLSVVK